MTGKKWLRAAFVAYGAVMIWLLFNRSGAAEGVPYWQQVEGSLNLVPFHTIGNYWNVLLRSAYYTQRWGAERYAFIVRHSVINLAGNIVMFVPLGFLIPAVWERHREFWKSIACAAGIILTVELLQLFTLVGSCDIDDLILNLIGVVIGYGVFRWTPLRRR